MKTPGIANAMQQLDEDLICDAIEYQPKKAAQPHSKWKKWASLAACLLIAAAAIGYIPFWGSPAALVVTVHALNPDQTGSGIELKLNEKIQLSPGTSSFDSRYQGYAFDLTQIPGSYVAIAGVSPDNTVPVFPSGYYATHLAPWALSEGNEIFLIYSNEDGSVPEVYKTGECQPEPKSKSVIWIPNSETGIDRLRIIIYNSRFEQAMTVYLQVFQEDTAVFAMLQAE